MCSVDITKMKDLLTAIGVLIILPLAKPLEPGCENRNLISGVESLPNSSFTASSYWSRIDTCLPHFGRLNATGLLFVYCGAWAPSVASQEEYIQVHLGKMMHITKILTQGRHDGGNMAQQVTSYRVRYSVDAKVWSWLKDGSGNALILTGNTGSATATVEQILSTPITAMFIRIYPYTWIRYPSLRFDVIGWIKQVADEDDLSDMKTACRTLYCNRNFPQARLPISNLTSSCTYNKNQHLSICSYGNSSSAECLDYERFRYGNDIKEIMELTCKKFKIKCHGGCGTDGYKYAKVEENKGFRRIGFISTRNNNVPEGYPLLSCTKIIIYNNNIESFRVKFERTHNCSERNYFICGKEEEENHEICNLKNLIDRPKITTPLTTKSDNPQTTTTEITENKGKTLAQKSVINAGETAGIAIGACFLVVLVIVITLVICKRYRYVKLRRELQSQQFSKIASTNPSYERASYAEMTSEYDYIKEPDHYKTIESDYNKNEIDTTTGYEEPFNLQENYFILEPENTKLSVESNTKVDKESDCDYIDTKEGDYDHLHDTKQRKTTDHTNVYEHGHAIDNKDNKYDTTKSHSIESDGSHYDSTLHAQQKDDNDMKP